MYATTSAMTNMLIKIQHKKKNLNFLLTQRTALRTFWIVCVSFVYILFFFDCLFRVKRKEIVWNGRSQSNNMTMTMYVIRYVIWTYSHLHRVRRSFMTNANKQANEIVVLSYRPNALNSATISPRFSLKCWFTFPLILLIGFVLAKLRSNFSEKRIFSAVPRPCTCSFPHNRHLSQPTQSMIFDMLRNFSRNSVFSWAAPVLLNIRLSLKCDGNDLQWNAHCGAVNCGYATMSSK